MFDKVKEWLKTQGFSLEMRTAAAFRKAGFSVRQSAHYFDRGEGKGREMDVIATRQAKPGRSAVHFVIECKSSSRPWVVLVSSDTLSRIDRNRLLGILSHAGLDTFSELQQSELSKLPWYLTPDECGYALRKAFAGDRDDAFSASAAVCKAAQWTVLPMQMDDRRLPTYALSFPVIVVDTPILECRLDREGDTALSEVQQSQYLFEDHQVFDALVRMRVVHVDSLFDFAREAFEVATTYQRFLDELPAPRSYEERTSPTCGS